MGWRSYASQTSSRLRSSVDEIWVSGDGRTLYATADAGKRLAVIAEDGSAVKIVTPPAQMGGFIASERG